MWEYSKDIFLSLWDFVQLLIRPLICLFQKAEAELAYELQAAKEKQKIRSEEIEIEVVERRKQIDVEEKEILRKEKELIGTVKRPAEAEAYKLQVLAEGNRWVLVSDHWFITRNNVIRYIKSSIDIVLF